MSGTTLYRLRITIRGVLNHDEIKKIDRMSFVCEEVLVVSHADFRMNDGSKSYNLVDNQSLAANPLKALCVETRRLSGNGPGFKLR